MKRLATFLVVFLFTASLSLAQGMMGMRGGMMGGMHPMMYSTMVHHVLMKANTLDLTDAQKKELANIQDKYLYPLIQKEADFKISHMKIMSMLQDPNFDASKVKAEIKASNDINLEMANMSIDALTAIRKTIGIDKFKKISGMMSMMGSGMMMGEEEKMMEEKPAQEKKEDSGEHEEHH